jgi:hypothetical protein
VNVPDQYRNDLLRETRDELAKADAKASILLAASGIAASAFVTVGNGGTWYPENLADHVARVFAWAAIGLTLAGIVTVGMAVKPRMRARHDVIGPPHYFGDVEGYRPPWWKIRARATKLRTQRTKFRNDLESTSMPELRERVDDQIWTLSHIAYRKYWLVSLGMRLYGLALLAGLVAFLTEKQWL